MCVFLLTILFLYFLPDNSHRYRHDKLDKNINFVLVQKILCRRFCMNKDFLSLFIYPACSDIFFHVLKSIRKYSKYICTEKIECISLLPVVFMYLSRLCEYKFSKLVANNIEGGCWWNVDNRCTLNGIRGLDIGLSLNTRVQL